jgi:hypothetical protein
MPPKGAGQEWLDEEDINFSDFEALLCALVVSVLRQDSNRAWSFAVELQRDFKEELAQASDVLEIVEPWLKGQL